MELRPNQIQPVKKGVEFFKKPSPPCLMVLPVAWGKSILVAQLAAETEGNLICLQPSMELLVQNVSKYEELVGEAPAIYSASVKKKEMGRVVYATLGSIKTMGCLFKDLGYTKMIIDEADRYSRSESGMLSNFLSSSGINHVLGMTATPFKLNTSSMNMVKYSTNQMLTSRSQKGFNLFKDFLHVSQVKEMVEGGYWCPIIYEKVQMKNDKLVFNTTFSEFTEESVQAFYEDNNIHGMIMSKLDQLEDRRSILVAVPTVADARAIAAMRQDTVAVWGDMPKPERVKAVDDFKQGRVRVMTQVNTMNIGFDHPGLDCFVCARATASLSLFYQMFGRIVRIHPDGKDSLFVDMSGGLERFGDMRELRYEKIKRSWVLVGEGGRQLTNVDINDIGKVIAPIGGVGDTVLTFGKYKGTKVKDIPIFYRNWMLQNIKWNK